MSTHDDTNARIHRAKVYGRAFIVAVDAGDVGAAKVIAQQITDVLEPIDRVVNDLSKLTVDELCNRIDECIPTTAPRRNEAIEALIELGDRYVLSAVATDRFLWWMAESVGNKTGSEIAAMVRAGGFDPWAGPPRAR